MATATARDRMPRRRRSRLRRASRRALRKPANEVPGPSLGNAGFRHLEAAPAAASRGGARGVSGVARRTASGARGGDGLVMSGRSSAESAPKSGSLPGPASAQVRACSLDLPRRRRSIEREIVAGRGREARRIGFPSSGSGGGGQREVVAAIAAAFDVVEAQVPALRALHGARPVDRQCSCCWMSARSRSASGRCGSVGAHPIERLQRIVQLAARGERTRACERGLPASRNRQRPIGRRRRRRRLRRRLRQHRAPLLDVRDGEDRRRGNDDEPGRGPGDDTRSARRTCGGRRRAGRTPPLVRATGAWATGVDPCSRRFSRSSSASASSLGAPCSMAASSSRRASPASPRLNAATPSCSSSSDSRCRSASALRARSM